MGHSHQQEVRNPGSYQLSHNVKVLFLAFIAIGLVAFLVGLSVDSKRAWSSFVMNHFYFMGIAICGVFFAVVQWLTGAMWSAPVRRLFESMSAYLPFVLVSFVILYFGLHTLYHWTHMEDVMKDPILYNKKGYLNETFFMIRNVIAILIWIFFAKKMIGNSLKQDQEKGNQSWTEKNKTLAPGFLILFALTFTMASFDLLMSLDPHWFSTMFGVYCFAGSFYAVLALVTILTVHLKKNGALEGIVNENHLHDLGKFMFAFTVFYAYIGFSQYMLIWYANLPEETGYFIKRSTDTWAPVFIFLLVGKFMVPFFALLPRDAKRSPSRLLKVGVFMLLAHWVDVLWMVQPEFFSSPKFGWIEVGVTLGFFGVFATLIARFLAKNNIVAIGDPRLSESVFHHHQ